MPQNKIIKKVRSAKFLTKKELIEELNNVVEVNQIYSTALMILWDAVVILGSKKGENINYGDLARLIKTIEFSYIKDINNQYRKKELQQEEAEYLVDNIKNSTYVIWSTFLSIVPIASDIT